MKLFTATLLAFGLAAAGPVAADDRSAGMSDPAKAQYKRAKQNCQNMSGMARDNCLKDAKAAYSKAKSDSTAGAPAGGAGVEQPAKALGTATGSTASDATSGGDTGATGNTGTGYEGTSTSGQTPMRGGQTGGAPADPSAAGVPRSGDAAAPAAGVGYEGTSSSGQTPPRGSQTGGAPADPNAAGVAPGAGGAAASGTGTSGVGYGGTSDSGQTPPLGPQTGGAVAEPEAAGVPTQPAGTASVPGSSEAGAAESDITAPYRQAVEQCNRLSGMAKDSCLREVERSYNPTQKQ